MKNWLLIRNYGGQKAVECHIENDVRKVESRILYQEKLSYSEGETLIICSVKEKLNIKSHIYIVPFLWDVQSRQIHWKKKEIDYWFSKNEDMGSNVELLLIR